MSMEEDIGGLKADMRTVRDQTSRISDKMDDMSMVITTHMASEASRLLVLEDRYDDLKVHIEETVEPDLKSLVQSRSRAKGVITGIGATAGITAATLTEILRSVFRGGIQ